MVNEPPPNAPAPPGPPAGPDDEVLVRRARAGDDRAAELLLRRHAGVVYRYLLGRVGSEADAEDLAQESLVKALRGLGGLEDPGAFRGWLLGIARNESRSWLRALARRRESPLEGAGELADEASGPADRALRRAEVESVRDAIGALPEKQRLSVILRLHDGLGFREIGKLTGSTEGAARVNYHHGIRRLRERLGGGRTGREDPDVPGAPGPGRPKGTDGEEREDG